MDGGAIVAIAGSVGPMLLVVIGAGYHLGNKIGQHTQKMNSYHQRLDHHHERLESLEEDCKELPAISAKVDILEQRTVRIEDTLNSRIHRRRKSDG